MQDRLFSGPCVVHKPLNGGDGGAADYGAGGSGLGSPLLSPLLSPAAVSAVAGSGGGDGVVSRVRLQVDSVTPRMLQHQQAAAPGGPGGGLLSLGGGFGSGGGSGGGGGGPLIYVLLDGQAYDVGNDAGARVAVPRALGLFSHLLLHTAGGWVGGGGGKGGGASAGARGSTGSRVGVDLRRALRRLLPAAGGGALRDDPEGVWGILA